MTPPCLQPPSHLVQTERATAGEVCNVGRQKHTPTHVHGHTHASTSITVIQVCNDNKRSKH